jgi:prepilin-type N-terminal cleavage/methylation domain-containing protein
MRRARLQSESGFTLVELLVASAMGVILLGAVGSMVTSAVRSQPKLSQRSQNVTTARWVLGRMTREIRNGVAVDKATSSSVSFRTYVRHTSCGSTGTLASESSAIPCEVTYTCTTTYCSRLETKPEVYTGTGTKIFSGIDSSSVFSYSPSAEKATYVGVSLHIPNPSGSGLTISDGASLRNATLSN